MLEGLHGLQVLRLDSEEDVLSKSDGRERSRASNTETLPDAFQDFMVTEGLQAVAEEVGSIDAIPLREGRR